MKRRQFLGALATGISMAPQIHSGTPGGEQSPSAPRRRENFNAGWRFQRQAHGGGALGSWGRDSSTGSQVEPRFREAHQAGYDDSSWEAIYLPHTWNAHDTSDEIPGYFRGLGWYRKHFTAAEELRGKRIFLEFEAVNQVCEFWLNGAMVGEHKGGYTGFEIDITDRVQFGAVGNVLTVKVDNLYNANIAPTVKTDLTFYGGIYRDVWLRVSEPVYISTVYWRTPAVSAPSAEIDVYSVIANTTSRAARLRIVHEISTPLARLRVLSPRR